MASGEPTSADVTNIRAICSIIRKYVSGENTVSEMVKLTGETKVLHAELGFFCSRKFQSAASLCECARDWEFLFFIPVEQVTSEPVLDRMLDNVIKGECFHSANVSFTPHSHALKLLRERTSVGFGHLAAALNDVETLKFLHANGCNLDVPSTVYALRPIHIAVIKGHKSAVEYLLLGNVKVNAREKALVYPKKTGDNHLLCLSPFQIALTHANGTVLKQFQIYSKRGEVLIENTDDFIQSLQHALVSESPKVMSVVCEIGHKFIGEARKLLLEDKEKFGVFNKVFWSGGIRNKYLYLAKSKMLQILLKYGIPMDIQKFCVHATINNDVDLVKVMLETVGIKDCCNSNFSGYCGFHPRDIAVAFGYEEMADFMKKAGVPVTNPVMSPFLLIFNRNLDLDDDQRISLIDRLRVQGHDVNKRGEQGFTALHLAVMKYRRFGADLKILQSLLNVGGDLNLCSNDGDSPYSVSVKWMSNTQIRHVIYLGNPLLEQPINLKHCGLYTPVSPLVFAMEHWGNKMNMELMAILFLAGYVCSKEDLAELTCKRHIAKLSGDQDDKTWASIRKQAFSPASLKNQCRFSLRRTYRGWRIHRLVQSIGYPQPLKNFILVKELISE